MQLKIWFSYITSLSCSAVRPWERVKRVENSKSMSLRARKIIIVHKQTIAPLYVQSNFNFATACMVSALYLYALFKTFASDLCLIYKLQPKARREFVYQIKIGCECFNVLKKRPMLGVNRRSNFKNEHCLTRENQSWSFICKSGQVFIRFKNID
jgi:hypothetical protein